MREYLIQPIVEEPIIGVDVRPFSSPYSKKRAKYSVAVLSHGEIVYSSHSVSLHDIKSLINEYHAKTLAVDNIKELFKRKSELYKFIESLPADLTLIQVTGSPIHGFKSVKSLAKEAGIIAKVDSSRGEAEVIARLASLGYGCKIILHENEAKIIIAKSSSVKKGGSGSDRWRRLSESLILEESRVIEERLKSVGIDYDLYTVSGEGGLSKAEFIVYSGRKGLSRIVRPYIGSNIKVVVEPIRKKSIGYIKIGDVEPRVNRKPIMVSIDPGMSTGICIFDMFGNLLLLKTLRKPTRSMLIEEISKYGIPTIITCDKSPVPKSIVKIAKIFGAKIHKMETLTLEEKRQLLQKYNIKVETSHERDAFAAMVKTYNSYLNLWRKAESHAKESGLNMPSDKLRALVSEGVPISEAIKLIKSEVPHKKAEQRRPVVPGTSDLKGEIERLKSKLIEKEQEISKLREEVSTYKREIKDLRAVLDSIHDKTLIKIKRDRAIKLRDERIRYLENEIARLRRRMRELEIELEMERRRNKVEEFYQLERAEVIDKLSKNIVEEAITKKRIKPGSILVVKDASGAGRVAAEKISKLSPSAIIVLGNLPPEPALSVFKCFKIPVIPASEVKIKILGDIAIFNPEDVEKVKKRFLPKIDGQPRFSEDVVRKLIVEYRKKLISQES